MRSFFLILALLFLVSVVVAHPGRTDGGGGHYVRTPGYGYPVGSYHYHDTEPSYSVAPIRVPKPAMNIAHSGFSRDDYKLIQQDLKQSGFYSGAIDGIFGPRSLQSLKNYQAVVNKLHLTEQEMLTAVLKAAKTNVKMQAESAIVTPDVEESAYLVTTGVDTSPAVVKSLEGRLVNGKTYVPLREISEAIGAKIEWNDAEKTAYLVLPNSSRLRVQNQ